VRFRSTLLIAAGSLPTLGGAWLGIALLALDRTTGWSCAGG
jgi:hypothetical protein